MKEENLNYTAHDITSKAFIAKPDENQNKPAVLVCHAWMGQDEFAKDRARKLASLGYVGIALDLYGEGKLATNEEEAGKLMLPLFIDRALLRKRVEAGFQFASSLPYVDKNKIGAIGFCFGGLTVIELLRSGATVKGVVSFHGVLGSEVNGHKAKFEKDENMKGALLVLHGVHDPKNTWKDIENLTNEMTEHKVDWEIDLYDAVHGFTNPQAKDKNSGLMYNPKVADRAFKKMELFFSEIF